MVFGSSREKWVGSFFSRTMSLSMSASSSCNQRKLYLQTWWLAPPNGDNLILNTRLLAFVRSAWSVFPNGCWKTMSPYCCDKFVFLNNRRKLCSQIKNVLCVLKKAEITHKKQEINKLPMEKSRLLQFQSQMVKWFKSSRGYTDCKINFKWFAKHQMAAKTKNNWQETHPPTYQPHKLTSRSQSPVF